MDNFDLRKYLVENKATTNSKMMNENEADKAVDSIIDKFISRFGEISSETRKKFKEAIYMDYEDTPQSLSQMTLNDAVEIFDASGLSLEEDDLEENKVTTNSKMVNEAEVKDVKTVIARHKTGLLSALKARRANPEDLDAHNEVKKYLETIASELGLDKNIPFMEDEMYSGRVKPLEALKHVEETFTDWVEDSEMMNENSDNIKDQISNWYHKTNFYIDEKSPEEAEDGINAHYDEYMAVKDQYDNIQDYFEDVERAGDWY